MIQQSGAPPSRGLDQPSVDSNSRAKPIAIASTPARKYFWQVRHSGLLGLKYLVAVKGDLIRGRRETTHINNEGDQADANAPYLLKGVVDAALLG